MEATGQIQMAAPNRPMARAVRLVLAAAAWSALTVACLTGPSVALAAEGDGAPSAADSAALVATGKRVYTSMCTRCHGINLVSNGIGFDLRQFPANGRERFERSVNEGLRAMPAWKTLLKPGDMVALWAYVGSVNGWAPEAR